MDLIRNKLKEIGFTETLGSGNELWADRIYTMYFSAEWQGSYTTKIISKSNWNFEIHRNHSGACTGDEGYGYVPFIGHISTLDQLIIIFDCTGVTNDIKRFKDEL